MRSIRALVVLSVVVLLALPAFSLICTTTCEPNPTDGTYLGTVQNRIKIFNARGSKSVFQPAAGSRIRTGNGSAEAVPGSESYNNAFPILHLGGRNGLDVDLTLYYSSGIWTIRRSGSTVTGATLNGDRDVPSYGFRVGYGYMEYDATDDFYTLTESDGTKHQLTYADAISYESNDNTFIRFYPATGILRYKSGATLFYELIPDASNDNLRRPYQIQDTNGNYISVSYKKNYWVSGAPVRAITTANIPTGRPINDAGWLGQEIDTITDTLGRAIAFNYDTSKKLTTISQGGRTWTFGWNTAYTLKYYFTFTVTNSPANLSTQSVLTSITYPNSTSYSFVYGDWGIIKQIQQKSSNGAVRSYLSYNYPAAVSGTPLSDHPTFTTQTLSPDGAAANAWTHAVTKSNGAVTSYSITDPTGLKAKTNLDSNGLTSSVVISNGTSTYRTTTNTWSGAPGSNPRITSTLTTLNDTNQQTRIDLAYDSYGNVNDVKEYDYGLVLARHITTTYKTDTAYVNDRLLDRATQILVYDGSGNLKARTDLAYDGGTLLSRTGTIAGHSPSFDANKTDRGNVTTVTRYADAAGATGSIARNSSYDILGNLVSADLDCCNRRTWEFSSADSYSFPTSTTAGTSPSLTTTFTYYSDTGLPHTIADPNGKVTTLTYDSMDRLTQTTRPDAVTVTTSYDDQSLSPAVTQTTPIDTTPKNAVSISTFNGLGRLTRSQLKDNSGTPISIVDRTYDAAGRLASVTNPYVSGTPASTSYQYDGLGRIAKTIPTDGSQTSNNWSYAYSGNQVTTTDPASKQRRNYTDALGRLVRVDEPGGTPGSGSVTISGAGQVDTQYNCVLDPDTGHYVCDTYVDNGTITITVNGYSKTVSYPSGGTSASALATALANAINADANEPVAAGSSGATVNLTSKTSGANTNYTLAASTTYDHYFSQPSYTATPSGANLAGGVDTVGTPSLANPFATYYTYDVLDDLTQVSQGMQTRTYVYNSLGQLTSATTPESGTVNYSYTDFGAVYQRTDARSQVTTYCYDGLNRLTKTSYTNDPNCTAPNLQNNYDEGGSAANANGRLTSTIDSLGGEAYSYDQLGRITQASKTIDTTQFNTLYSYNLAGEVTQIQYPSGRQVNQSYDSIGHMSQVASGTVNYFSASGYNPASQLLGGTYGNSIAATFSYNGRLQLDTLKYTRSATDIFSLAYGYGYGTANNGQIQSVTDNVDSSRSMTYTYDEWTRLKTAQAGSGPTWKLQFVYDRYGNRTNQNVLYGNAPSPQTPTNGSTNHLIGTGYSYDASGNLTGDGSHAYTYDAENRIATVDTTGAVYSYSAGNVRVKKVVGTSTTYYIFSGTKVIAEYSSLTPSAPDKEYIYWGGQVVATIAGGATTYQFRDHLSTRYETDATAADYRQFGHLPFGETWYESGAPSKWKFTNYERDSESALDYAVFRSYSSTIGRFATPDPLAGNLSVPQSLNRYAYIQNDPINATDPVGLFIAVTPVTGCDVTCQLAAIGISWERKRIPWITEYEKERERFAECLKKFGDALAQANLTFEGYWAAQQAAATAQIDTSSVLALWANEHSLMFDWPKEVGPRGEIGPGQVRPGAITDLRRWGVLPNGYDSDKTANLTAAALYFEGMSSHYNVPEKDAPSAYNGGEANYHKGTVSDDAQTYQDNFNQHKAAYTKLVNCVRGQQ